MQILELNILLLIGTLCGGIHDTSPISHSVYQENEDLELRLEISCIQSKRRDKYIQEIQKL